MPHIYYQPDDRSVETQPEETILQTSLRERILHAHACGGHARCSTCRVVVLEGLEHCSPRSTEEQALPDSDRSAFRRSRGGDHWRRGYDKSCSDWRCREPRQPD